MFFVNVGASKTSINIDFSEKQTNIFLTVTVHYLLAPLAPPFNQAPGADRPTVATSLTSMDMNPLAEAPKNL